MVGPIYGEARDLRGLCFLSLLCMMCSLVHTKAVVSGKAFLAHVAAEGPLPGVGPLVVHQMSPVIEGPGAVRALVVQSAAVLKLDLGGHVGDRMGGRMSGQGLVAEETEVAHFAGVRLTVAVQVL